MVNSISFKGTFCIPDSEYFRKSQNKIFRKEQRYQMQVDRIYLSDKNAETYITVPDTKDDKVAKLLEKYDIPHYYINTANRLNKEEIFDRIKLSDLQKMFGFRLVNVNVSMLDKVLKHNPESYVGYKGNGGSKEKYDRFVKFLHTNHDIQAPKLAIIKKLDGGLSVELTDGRHRFAVLRDIGMERILVAMSEESLKNAREAKLIKS